MVKHCSKWHYDLVHCLDICQFKSVCMYGSVDIKASPTACPMTGITNVLDLKHEKKTG